MPANDTYRITVYMDKAGQEMLSIYHYFQTVGTGDATDLLADFISNVVPSLQNLLSASITIDDLECVCLENPTDFDTNGGNYPGLVSGENASPATTYSIQLHTNRLDAKDGGKHLPGVIEGYVNNGDIVSGIPQLRLATAMLAMEAILTPAANAYRPCIVGKRRGQLGLFNNNISAAEFRGVQTQNSRKVYL